MSAGARPRQRDSVLRALPRARIGTALAKTQGTLLSAEVLLPHRDSVLQRFAPIFIVGAPRCGSTLVMQVLSRCLDVSYLSNRHAHLAGAPALVERFARPQMEGLAPFRSELGHTDGATGPSECGQWWYRFFPTDPVYVTSGQLDVLTARRFRRSLAALTAAANRSFLIKNLYASLRIREIARIIPESRFIHLVRDVSDNAHSLLEARYRANGNYENWFSLPPPGWEDASVLTPAEQVVWQVSATNAIVRRDLSDAALPPKATIDLAYEEFCTSPAAWVRAIGAALQVGVDEDTICYLPESFERRADTRIPTEMNADLAAAVARLEGA